MLYVIYFIKNKFNELFIKFLKLNIIPLGLLNYPSQNVYNLNAINKVIVVISKIFFVVV